MNTDNRVLGRLLAQELTQEEINQVAGGASGGAGTTYSGGGYGRPGMQDDQCPTDAF